MLYEVITSGRGLNQQQKSRYCGFFVGREALANRGHIGLLLRALPQRLHMTVGIFLLQPYAEAPQLVEVLDDWLPGVSQWNAIRITSYNVCYTKLLR